MAQTRAQSNRTIRQDALREQLAGQGHLQHVVDLLGEVTELEMSEVDRESHAITKFEMDKRLAVVDRKLKLIGKYLPDLKQVELELGEDTTEAVRIVWGKSRS